MAVQVGDKIPQVDSLTVLVDGRKAKVSVAELFGGKRVVLFAVPGAFTPTCSAKHLPGYVAQADAILSRGVGEIICIATNDAYVMEAWGRSQGAARIRMVGDGNADITRALGLEKDGRDGGMGIRSQRYALVADDGVVTQLYVEEPGKFEVSAAEYVLARLGSRG
jgi:peroxiredoxin